MKFYPNSLCLLLIFASLTPCISPAIPGDSIRKVTTGAYDPVTYFDTTMESLKNEVLNRPTITHPATKIILSPAGTRNAWLERVYAAGLVEYSEYSRILSDKLIMANMIDAFDGAEGARFYPKTIGLKYFLAKHNLLNHDHSLRKDSEKIMKELRQEFPFGFIVKPAAGINSAGKSKGFYFKMDKFVKDLVADDTDLYQSRDYTTPFRSPLLDMVASGEYLIIQENVVLAGGNKNILQPKEFIEVRIHTFEDKVLPDATYPRWKETKIAVPQVDLDSATKFAQKFLDSLPKQMLAKQAWSADIAIVGNHLQVIDINTNRGYPHQWSGYMPRPGVLTAYTKHLEKYKNVEFSGVPGFLFRHGLGNYSKYFKKVYIEGIY